MQYNIQYTDRKERFDEEVVHGDVTVLIDSNALLSIIGSEMDFVEDKLSSGFVFKNPNVTKSCGCGLSFAVS